MREGFSNNCPFADQLLKAICRGDAQALSPVFGQSGAHGLVKLYRDLNMHQQQLFIVLLPSAIVRELQRLPVNAAAAAIKAAVSATLIRAGGSDYDTIVVNHTVDQ